MDRMVLVPVILLAFYLGYSPFSVGAIAGISITIWIITQSLVRNERVLHLNRPG